MLPLGEWVACSPAVGALVSFPPNGLRDVLSGCLDLEAIAASSSSAGENWRKMNFETCSAPRYLSSIQMVVEIIPKKVTLRDVGSAKNASISPKDSWFGPKSSSLPLLPFPLARSLLTPCATNSGILLSLRLRSLAIAFAWGNSFHTISFLSGQLEVLE